MGGGGGSEDELKYTSDQQAQQIKNAKLWNYYEENYLPLQQKYIALETDPATTKQEENQIKGKINAEAVKKLDPLKLSTNPVANARSLNNLGKTETTAQVTGEGQVRSRELANRQNIINIGQQKEVGAVTDLNTLAGRSLDVAISDLDRQEKVGASADNAIGAGIGAAAAGLNRAWDKSTTK